MYDYTENTFAIVITGLQSRDDLFWLAKILNINFNRHNAAVRLSVHWYLVGNRKRIWDGADYPALREIGHKKREPWIDEIETDTIMAVFDSLTKKKTIPLSAKRKIC